MLKYLLKNETNVCKKFSESHKNVRFLQKDFCNVSSFCFLFFCGLGRYGFTHLILSLPHEIVTKIASKLSYYLINSEENGHDFNQKKCLEEMKTNLLFFFFLRKIVEENGILLSEENNSKNCHALLPLTSYQKK